MKGHGSELMGKVLKCAWSTSKGKSEQGEKRKYDPSKYLYCPSKKKQACQPISQQRTLKTQNDTKSTSSSPTMQPAVIPPPPPPSKPTDFYPSGKLGAAEFMQYAQYCQYWMHYYQMVYQNQIKGSVQEQAQEEDE